MSQPALKTLVYAPSAEVYIQTKDKVIHNLSADIVSCTVNRVVNGCSQATVTLANRVAAKYQSIFTPMDKILIYAKRLTRFQLFTGYLDTVPCANLWNTEVTIQASDSIKLLQNLYWDANLWSSYLLYETYSETNMTTDAGMGQAAWNILTQVAKWPDTSIGIQSLPSDFFTWAADVFTNDAFPQSSAAAIAQWETVVGAGSPLGSTDTSGSGATGGDALEIAGKKFTTIKQWAIDFLTLASLPTTSVNVDNIVQWEAWESGYFSTGKWNNPLNTTQPGFGGVSAKAKQANIQKYPTYAQGLQATVKTLKNGKYAGIITALKNSYPVDWFKYSVGQSPWGTFTSAKRPSGNPPAGASGQSGNSGGTKTLLGIAATLEGISYSWGGGNLKGPTKGTNQGAGTVGFDCSSFTRYVANKCGVLLPRTSPAQWKWFSGGGAGAVGPHGSTGATNRQGWKYPNSQRKVQAGDFLYFAKKSSPGTISHTAIAVNGKTMIAAPHTGSVVGTGNIPFKGRSGTTDDYLVGFGALTGVPVGSLDGGNSSTTMNSSGASPAATPLETAFYLIYGLPNSENSYALQGERAYINDEPVWKKISSLFQASMRDVSTLPNGDLIAWFPDKFGRWEGYKGSDGKLHHKDPYFIIEDVELKDIDISCTDQGLYTDIYVAGAGNEPNQQITTADWQMTNGIVSVTQKGIMDCLVSGAASNDNLSAANIYKRYGLRPQVIQEPTVINTSIFPFMLALKTFMDSWSSMYSATASLTFMPELLPGGRVQINCTAKNENLVFYIEGVSHSMSYTGGFTTSLTLSSPTVWDANSKTYKIYSGGLA